MFAKKILIESPEPTWVGDLIPRMVSNYAGKAVHEHFDPAELFNHVSKVINEDVFPYPGQDIHIMNFDEYGDMLIYQAKMDPTDYRKYYWLVLPFAKKYLRK